MVRGGLLRTTGAAVSALPVVGCVLVPLRAGLELLRRRRLRGCSAKQFRDQAKAPNQHRKKVSSEEGSLRPSFHRGTSFPLRAVFPGVRRDVRRAETSCLTWFPMSHTGRAGCLTSTMKLECQTSVKYLWSLCLTSNLMSNTWLAGVSHTPRTRHKPPMSNKRQIMVFLLFDFKSDVKQLGF